jgi:gluconate kinase
MQAHEALSDLSSRLFRDVVDNHALVVRELADIERERLVALEAIQGAAPALQKWRSDVADAGHAASRLIHKIDDDLADAERASGERRRVTLVQIDARLRQADARAAADAARRDEHARTIYERELARIADGAADPGRQILARADAHRQLVAGIDDSRRAWLKDLEANKTAHVDEVRNALLKESADAAAAREEARVLRERASTINARALKAAETRLHESLAHLPAATLVQSQFDRRRDEAKRRSRDREAALFDAYRAARETLEGAASRVG